MKTVNVVEEAPERELKPILEHKLVVAESRRITHHIVLESGSRFEDVFVPDYWQLAASKLHRRDLVEVEPPDGSFWALLLVVATGPEYAEVALLQKVELPARPRSVDDLPLGHSVFFLGSKRLWAALRGESIIKCGFTTKDDAVAYIIETTRS